MIKSFIFKTKLKEIKKQEKYAIKYRYNNNYILGENLLKLQICNIIIVY